MWEPLYEQRKNDYSRAVDKIMTDTYGVFNTELLPSQSDSGKANLLEQIENQVT